MYSYYAHYFDLIFRNFMSFSLFIKCITMSLMKKENSPITYTEIRNFTTTNENNRKLKH